ncbi:MAG: hypothetical protein EPO50_19050 [Reyranella sp.]|nr:MAG: hypothetical protein EPO50_19050 [Reyranella sp.]
MSAALLVVLTGVAGNTYLVRLGLVGDLGLAIASIAGCVVVLAILSAVSTRFLVVTLLLVGLMLGYLCVGLINVSLHFIDEICAKAFKVWDDASFAGATWRQLTILCPGDLVTAAGASYLPSQCGDRLGRGTSRPFRFAAKQGASVVGSTLVRIAVACSNGVAGSRHNSSHLLTVLCLAGSHHNATKFSQIHLRSRLNSS